LSASKVRRWQNQATKKIAWFHRWLGIATCLVFALWFASGAVLLFKAFPSLPRTDQLKLASPIDTAAVRIAPHAAIKSAGGAADGLRLVQRASIPAYVVSSPQGTVIIDARTGARLGPLSRPDAQMIGHRTIGEGAVAPMAFDYDQWVVHNRFDPLRPFYRYDTHDEAGTRYYVSAATGELVQRTNMGDRGWNWIGAVLHWAYFTPLRSNFSAWDWTVWSLSFVAMLVAIAGIILGVIRTIAAQRQRKPSLTFYRLKWMRWHHLLGLFAGIFVLTWILSGWLSMDHGRLFSRGQPSAVEAAHYSGLPLAEGLARSNVAGLRNMGAAKEIDFSIVAGQAIAIAWGKNGQPKRFTAEGQILSEQALMALSGHAVTSAWPGGAEINIAKMTPFDLYALAEGWPATALRITDRSGTRPDIYIDGVDGHILTVMNASRKAYAWIYYGLHTFNFPGLAERPLLREILVLVPLLFGFVFSITGIVIGWQHLRKSF
jgi:uncharacterized iron-regulated membrane protein